MPSVYATEEDCTSALGKRMQRMRSDRPDEWTMDGFIRDAEKLNERLNDALDMLDDNAHAYLLRKWGDS